MAQAGIDRAYTRMLRLRLDEQGKQELAGLLAGLADELAQIEADSAERLERGPHAPVYESGFSIVPFIERPPPA